MKFLSKRALMVLLAASTLLYACFSVQKPDTKSIQSGAAIPRPFGGLAPVQLPSDARAMSDYLKARVAANEGDRKEALKDYEATVQADPTDAGLRVQLATL